MNKFKVKTGRSKGGLLGYSLEPVSEVLRVKQSDAKLKSQPVTGKDIKDLQEALTWPPVDFRNMHILEMEKQRKSLNDVWADPHLDNTTKLLQAGLHSQLYSIANKKLFNRGEMGGEMLSNMWTTAPNAGAGASPPPSLLLPPQQQASAAGPMRGGKYSTPRAGPYGPDGFITPPASSKDARSVRSMIPRYRGRPLDMETSLLNVPYNRKTDIQRMAMALKSPQSNISWDSEGKLIDKTTGVRGGGRVMQGSNIQEVLSYAASPIGYNNPPKGYDRFREEILDSGLQSLLTPASEFAFKAHNKAVKRNQPHRNAKAKPKAPTYPYDDKEYDLQGARPKKKQAVITSTPKTGKSRKVDSTKLKFFS